MPTLAGAADMLVEKQRQNRGESIKGVGIGLVMQWEVQLCGIRLPALQAVQAECVGLTLTLVPILSGGEGQVIVRDILAHIKQVVISYNNFTVLLPAFGGIFHAVLGLGGIAAMVKPISGIAEAQPPAVPLIFSNRLTSWDYFAIITKIKTVYPIPPYRSIVCTFSRCRRGRGHSVVPLSYW